jgi:hypothetical protein
MAPAVATYAPRDPSSTVLYHVIAEHLETFLTSLNDDPESSGLPAYVQREFYDYFRCAVKAACRNVERPLGMQVPNEPLELSSLDHFRG